MHFGSKQGMHFFSPLNPQHGCPQGKTFSQVDCIKLMHSCFLQTSLNAGFMLGDGYFKSSKQYLHDFSFT
jgi:hypothetical protein